MDGSTLQTLIVALIVGAAALYVGSRWYRTIASARRKRQDGACGGGCGCGDKH